MLEIEPVGRLKATLLAAKRTPEARLARAPESESNDPA
jgi:hypothetical protein